MKHQLHHGILKIENLGCKKVCFLFFFQLHNVLTMFNIRMYSHFVSRFDYILREQGTIHYPVDELVAQCIYTYSTEHMILSVCGTK